MDCLSAQRYIAPFVKQTMSQIELSPDLLEMSTNPSMLKLLCLLSLQNGKIGQNRTSVFEDYTSYLLMQYHKKEKKAKLYSIKELFDFYRQNLSNAGKVALMGLRQNQLNLVFSKSEARRLGGDEIFDIGFLTELPSTDTKSVKVQFTHKTLQEYLAAFYVVNTPGDEGLQLLIEFCSTSQRLMGSQIILEFISNMSTNILRKEIQKKFEDFVSAWESDDKVNPKSRTSFLLSMLEGTETLKFPLPAVIDIDLYSSFKKSALERFFSLDGQCVRTINIGLGQNNRLNVLQNTKIDSLDVLNIDNSNTWSTQDNEDMCGVMKKMKPGKLSIKKCKWESINKTTIVVILQHVHTLILEYCDVKQEQLLSIIRTKHNLKVLKVNGEYYLRIDGKMVEALSKLSSDIRLDVSGKSITLIHRSPNKKCLNGVNIDTDIVEAVSRLPDDIHLDLSGNRLIKMDPRLLLLHMPNGKEIDITEWKITIDVDIVRALSRMSQLKSLKASRNELTPEAAREFFMSQLQQLELSHCGMNDTVCVSLMVSLSKHCPLLEVLDLRYNNLTSSGVIVYHIKHMKMLRWLCLSGNPCMKDQQCREEVEETLHISNPGLEVFTPCWF